MKNKKIDIVQGSDWYGVYVNGKLVLENHGLYSKDMLNALGIKYDVIEASDALEDFTYTNGYLPETLKGVLDAG